MKQSMYCLACESWELVSPVNQGHIVYLPPFEDEPAWLDYCYGPFVYSEPPAPLTEQEWQQVFTTEPAAEEMVLIDEDASDFFKVAE